MVAIAAPLLQGTMQLAGLQPAINRDKWGIAIGRTWEYDIYYRVNPVRVVGPSQWDLRGTNSGSEFEHFAVQSSEFVHWYRSKGSQVTSRRISALGISATVGPEFA